MMPRGPWWLGMVCCTALSMGLLWGTSLPLGIPGEWTWPRLPADAQSGWNLLLAGLAGAVYWAFVLYGGMRLHREDVRRVESGTWLVLLGLASLSWLWMVQETAPPAGQFAKAPFVLYYPSSSGYFHKVRYESPEVIPFLQSYEALMAQGEVLHVGTHPPGLFLVFHGLRTFQSLFPTTTQGFYSLAPESFREAMAIVRENSSLTEHPADEQDGVTLWLACLLALACAATTVWPLYGLLRINLSPAAAWWGAAFWPTVPALLIFLPKSDAAYPVLSCCLVLAMIQSWRHRSKWGAMLAGSLLFVSLMMSLAFLPVLLAGGLCVVTSFDRNRSEPKKTARDWLRQFVVWSLCLACGFLIPVALLAFCGPGISMPRVWAWNYTNHAAFYSQFQRTWWSWLLINPIELAIAVGIPLCFLAARGFQRLEGWSRPVSHAQRVVWSGIAVWGLLWVSGKNSGEAARLWILLMPGLVWLAGQSRHSEQTGSAPRSGIELTLAFQLAVCILTVHRLGGFHLAAP